MGRQEDDDQGFSVRSNIESITIRGRMPGELGQTTKEAALVVVAAQVGSTLFGHPPSLVYLGGLAASSGSSHFLVNFGITPRGVIDAFNTTQESERVEIPEDFQSLMRHTRGLANSRGVEIITEMDLLRGVATYEGMANRLLQQLVPGNLRGLFYTSLGVEQPQGSSGTSTPQE